MTSTRYTVDDVMTQSVVTVAPDTEFKEIADAMERWKVTAVPVVEDGARSSASSPKPTCSRRRSSTTTRPA